MRAHRGSHLRQGAYCHASAWYEFGRFTSDFGLVNGLNWLLAFDRWRMFGEEGYRYVKAKHSTEVGVNNHLRIYEGLIKK